MSYVLQITGVEEVKRKLRNMTTKTLANIVAETQRTAAELEVYSQNARPWTDRTGNARRSIYGTATVHGNNLAIYHGIGVDYGKYLELSNGGKYRVITPSVNKYRRIWLNNLKGTLGK